MDLVLTPEIDLVAASNASSEFASFATETPHPYFAGPGDDDEDDDDPATGGGGAGNIDPDDDDYADEEDEDDETPCGRHRDTVEYPRSLHCSIPCYNPLSALICEF
jgi:hypothetical protein